MQRPKIALIAAAGFARRWNDNCNKPVIKELLELEGKPVIQYLLEECLIAGIETVFLITRKQKQRYFNNFLKNCSNNLLAKLNIKYVLQNESDGWGSPFALKSAETYLGENEPFVLMFGDDAIYPPERGLNEILDKLNSDDEIVIGTTKKRNDIATEHAVVLLDEQDIPKRVLSKPIPSEVKGNYSVTVSRYVFANRNIILSNLLLKPQVGKKEPYISDTLNYLVRNNSVRLRTIDINGLWIPIDDPRRYSYEKNLLTSYIGNF